MDASSHFRGKKITVMGLGLLGRGVGDARYLAECGAELVVTDLKTREQLAESVAQLESFPNIKFVLGENGKPVNATQIIEGRMDKQGRLIKKTEDILQP